MKNSLNTKTTRSIIAMGLLLGVAAAQAAGGFTVTPGQEGLIKATFNSEGKTGVNHKTLNVFANTKETQNHSLVFTVELEKK